MASSSASRCSTAANRSSWTSTPRGGLLIDLVQSRATSGHWAISDLVSDRMCDVRQRLSRMHTCRAASCAGDRAVPVRACCRASSRRLRCCSAECNALHGIAHAVMRPCGCCLDRLKGLFMYFTVGSATASCMQKRPGERPVPRYHQKCFRSL